MAQHNITQNKPKNSRAVLAWQSQQQIGENSPQAKTGLGLGLSENNLTWVDLDWGQPALKRVWFAKWPEFLPLTRRVVRMS